jgi:nicotinamidase-related amidase
MPMSIDDISTTPIRAVIDSSSNTNILLLIDFQEGFLKTDTAHLRGPVQELVRDPFFSQVVATRFQNVEGSPWIDVLRWSGLRSSQEQKLAVEPPPNSIVIDKATYGLPQYVLTTLLPTFRGAEVFIAGIESDVCVAIIAASLFDEGIAPFILAEYIGTTRGADHQRHALITLSRIVGEEHLISDFKAWRKHVSASTERKNTAT